MSNEYPFTPQIQGPPLPYDVDYILECLQCGDEVDQDGDDFTCSCSQFNPEFDTSSPNTWHYVEYRTDNTGNEQPPLDGDA